MSKNKIIILSTVILLIIVIGIIFVLNSANNEVTNTTKNGSSNSITNNTNTIIPKTEDTIVANDTDIVINKKDITNVAKFYKYKSGDINMEIMAVKADDGSIRTALNTCQVCYDSGRGYYKQQGSYMVCQNCGNKFNINQIEKIKGGCNPVPILSENKTDNGDTITISKEYMESQKSYFENWKK